MIALLPFALGAGLVYLLLRPSPLWRGSGTGTGCAGVGCIGDASGGLSDGERALVSATLAMPNGDLLASAQPLGLDRAGVVADLYAAADLVTSKGHDVAARLLRDKAMLLSRERDVMPALPLPLPSGTSGGGSSWFAPSQPSPPSTAASSPGSSAQGGVEFPPVGQPVIAAMYCREAGCWVRPAPRPWNDATGRFGFKVPRGFRIDVTSFGPPGWVRVELDHPDDGRVPGFVELSGLTTDAPAPAPAAMPSAAAMPRAATGGARAGAARPAVLARPTAEQKKRMAAKRRARMRASGM